MNPLWLALSRHMNERLAGLRQQNDASLPMEATQQVRGRIAQIKELLALAEDKPPIA